MLDDQNKKIEIKTSGGHTCTLDDTARKITISGTSQIEMTAPQSITLKVGANSLELSMTNATLKTATSTVDLGPAGINVTANGGMTTIKGVTTTVKGDAMVAVNAPLINLG